ncbi:MAG: hypothetical protein V1720_17295 [bacterium]
MRSNKIFISTLLVFIISFLAFTFAELDQGYIKAFGYSSICVSKAGYPQKDFYDASQFEFTGGKFFVETGGSINLRALCPQGKTYDDLLKQFNNKHKEFSKMTEELVYWKIYSNYDFVGNKLFDKWPSDSEEMLHANQPLCFITYNTTSGIRDWITSGVDWTDTEGNDMQMDVGNWLSSAKPGWQLYILHTVGFRRNCPEDKFWDYNQGKEVIPIAYEMAKPFAVAIVEVK